MVYRGYYPSYALGCVFFTWDTVIREREDPGRVSVRLEAYAKEHNVAIVSSVITFLREQPFRWEHIPRL